MAFKWFGLSGGGKVFEFRCTDCSEIHRGSPSFAYKESPMVANLIPDAERQDRLHLAKCLAQSRERATFEDTGRLQDFRARL